MFEVQKLIVFKRQGMRLFPCAVSGCEQAQEIDALLQNAPVALRASLDVLITEGFHEMRTALEDLRLQNRGLDQQMRRMMSQAEDAFRTAIRIFTDEAKEGPRLFSCEPLEPGFLDRPGWVSAKFRLTLWCEHSRLPVSLIGSDRTVGVYEVSVPREWLIRAAPVLAVLASTLGLILPVAASASKVLLNEVAYKAIEAQLALGKSCAESLLKAGEGVGRWLTQSDELDLETRNVMRAEGAVLRQLHVWLREKDPTFGGLVRVLNRRQEFLWIHPKFEGEY